MILDGVLIESLEHLESLIVDLPIESQECLRIVWAELNLGNGE